MQWGPIGQEVFERTYQRTNQDGSPESWLDTVGRVVRGNLELAPDALEDLEAYRLEALLENGSAIPAGRHLWASGADTKLGLYNCHRAGWDGSLSGHFTFAFDQLMLGGGVGANYSQEYLDRSPEVTNKVALVLGLDPSHDDWDECWTLAHTVDPSLADFAFAVPDTREGWVDALEEVIEAHTAGRTVSLCVDFSDIRPRGSAIEGFGGIASGPGPLMAMLSNVNAVLNKLVGQHLTPLDAMAIDHEVAACVVSGNVRRSARMSILHWQDPSIFAFIACKLDPAAHWSTNISVEVDDAFFAALADQDPHAVAVLEDVTRGMHENGEPGFYNSSQASVGEEGDVRSTNPCGEIALEEWEQCCLGHVNLASFTDDHDGALEAFRLMTRYLMRSTLAASSDPRQEAVKNRNRRIGVGFFGFHDWAAIQGVRYEDIPNSPELARRLREYRSAVDNEAVAYAAELGIEVPVKTTTVAPTGSIAKLPGVSEGIQPPFARYFMRRVRYAESDPKLTELAAEGYHIEPCLYTPSTVVVSFPCRDEIMDKVLFPSYVMQSDEVSIKAYLRVQLMVQRIWANNAVSVTANFRREDASPEDLSGLLRRYLPLLKGWTAMPEDGRPQSPYERLTPAEYNALDHQGVGQAIDDCATGACPVR